MAQISCSFSQDAESIFSKSAINLAGESGFTFELHQHTSGVTFFYTPEYHIQLEKSGCHAPFQGFFKKDGDFFLKTSHGNVYNHEYERATSHRILSFGRAKKFGYSEMRDKGIRIGANKIMYREFRNFDALDNSKNKKILKIEGSLNKCTETELTEAICAREHMDSQLGVDFQERSLNFSCYKIWHGRLEMDLMHTEGHLRLILEGNILKGSLTDSDGRSVRFIQYPDKLHVFNYDRCTEILADGSMLQGFSPARMKPIPGLHLSSQFTLDLLPEQSRPRISSDASNERLEQSHRQLAATFPPKLQ